jgi:hypothetical protein
MQKPDIYRRSRKYLAVQSVADKNCHMESGTFNRKYPTRQKRAPRVTSAKKPETSGSSEES